jgi:spermidine/putrescine transport system ATP-binding protein
MAAGVGRGQGIAGEGAVAAADGLVSLTDVVKRFERVEAVSGLSLAVRKDEFVTLLGPSGCGKTTVLRMIGGFEAPDEGVVLVDGRAPVDTATRERRTRMVFQYYALFPHLSVYQNVAFGLRMRGERRASIEPRVRQMLDRMGLNDKGQRKPRQLSGGEQQRVALARALVTEPSVLLLDEPLGALDRQLRQRMQLELKELQRQLGITFIYVTHDQEEALRMSDRIVVMNRGRIEQSGPAEEIYERPRSRFVAEFIGETNFFEGEVVGVEGVRVSLRCGADVLLGCWNGEGLTPGPGARVALTVRPESVSCEFDVAPGAGLVGAVTDRIFVGSVTRTVVRLASGQRVLSDRLGNVPVRVGTPVGVSWPPDKAVVMTT